MCYYHLVNETLSLGLLLTKSQQASWLSLMPLWKSFDLTSGWWFGKVQHLDGGNLINASALVTFNNDHQDVMFIHGSHIFHHDSHKTYPASMKCLWTGIDDIQNDWSYLNHMFSLASCCISLLSNSKHLIHLDLQRRQLSSWLPFVPVQIQNRGRKQYLLQFTRGHPGDSGHGMHSMSWVDRWRIAIVGQWLTTAKTVPFPAA